MSEAQAGQAIRDALVLYELALSIGGSMSPEDNARQFLLALSRRKNLSYVSIWIDGDSWLESPGLFQLLLAVPKARSKACTVSKKHPVLPLIEQNEWLRIDDNNPVFDSLVAEEGVSGGVFVIFRLPRVGVLKLYASDSNALPELDIIKLRAVVKKFSLSMEGALAHQGLNESILQEQAAREELLHQQALTRSLIDSIPDLMFFKNTESEYLGCNDAFCEFVDKSKKEIVAKTDLDLFDPELGKFFRQQDRLMLQQSSSRRNEEWVTYPNGRRVLLDTLKTPYNGPQGELLGIIGISRDITEQRELRNELSFSDTLVNQSHDPIYCMDPADGFRMTFVNRAACRHWGYSFDQMVQMRLPELDSNFDLEDLEEFLAALRTTTGTKVFESIHRLADGREVPVEVSANLVESDDGREYLVGYARDITERQQAEQQIRHLAFHDPLTQLPNRRLFVDRLEHHHAQAQRYAEHFALLLMDLDHFKEVNDTMGHPVGDEYLQEVAYRLKKLIRESDTLSRLGGDEFAIIQGHVGGIKDVVALADKLRETLRIPFVTDGHTIVSSTSIGMVLCEGGSDDSPEDLLTHADVALYAAKSMGRDNYQFYEDQMRERVERELLVARRLSLALDDNNLGLAYQPQFELANEQLCGFEALLRWHDPELGEMSPVEFIPIAEKRGMIEAIGLWVTERVCWQAAKWLDQGFRFGRLAINLSRLQLRNPRHIEKIAHLIEMAAVPTHYLEIEITESGFSEASDEAMELLEELHKAGVSLSIDDFGTGYSSMVSLRQFKTDRLKIDREFIRDMLEDSDDSIIVKSIIALAKSLQMETVAEGVETEAQKVFLLNNGCDLVQGYLFSKPVPADVALQKYG